MLRISVERTILKIASVAHVTDVLLGDANAPVMQFRYLRLRRQNIPPYLQDLVNVLQRT